VCPYRTSFVYKFSVLIFHNSKVLLRCVSLIADCTIYGFDNDVICERSLIYF